MDNRLPNYAKLFAWTGSETRPVRFTCLRIDFEASADVY